MEREKLLESERLQRSRSDSSQGTHTGHTPPSFEKVSYFICFGFVLLEYSSYIIFVDFIVRGIWCFIFVKFL